MGLGDSGLFVGTARPVNPLFSARTVYVDSATGNDATGRGTAALPWATLGRAWSERQRYSVLRAKFTVQLIGVGPYEMPPMMGSQCEDEGFFVLRGDRAVEVLLATGTATGDMVGNTIPTSVLVADAHRNEFLRFTSGVETEGIYQLNANAANSVTVANSWLRFDGAPIVNGDTFEIFRAGTQVQISGGFGFIRMENLTGVSGANLFAEDVGRHVFYDLHFVSPDSSALELHGSQVTFSVCRCDLFVFAVGSSISCGLLDSEVVGLTGPSSPSRDLILGAGFVAFYMQMVSGRLVGTLSWEAGCVLSGGYVYFAWCGGIASGVATLYTAFLEGFGDFCDYLIEETIACVNAQAVCLFNASSGIWRFAVTSGPCIKVSNGGQLTVVTSDVTGGTTDAAEAAIDVSGGGRALFRGVSPAITGGTPGSDLRTTNVPIAANAALAVNGSSVAIAADALFGEVLGRLAG